MKSVAGDSRTIRFGAFELDGHAGELRKQGLKIRLQEQPLRVLQMLVANPGQLVSREELRTALWPSNSYIDFDQGLNRAINKLREALGDSAENPRFIETLARRGYRFFGDTCSEQRLIRSLLVLPLENLSRDPEQEYFADGLTEALITCLAKISALRVVSRTTAMVYKGVRKPLPEIARELNVEGIVEGTVMRAEGRARISAQLVHAPSDTHLWADIYDRDLRDVMALQMEVATAIVREVQVKLTPHEQSQLANPRPVEPEVYEIYLKGRYHWNKRTLVGMSKGAEYFQQAIHKDPLYAAAYAGLADSAARLGWWGYVSPQEGCARAIAVARKGLAIDDTLAEAHAALCFGLLHHDYAFRSAEEEGRRAVALDPKSAFAAQALGCCLITTARFEEGVYEAIRAAQLEPLSPILQWTAGSFHYHARQYDRALAYCHKCLELVPDFPAAKMTMAWIFAKTSSTDEVITELEAAVRETGGNHNFLGTLGYYHAVRRRPEEARKILSQLEEAAKQRYIPTLWPAVIHGSLGDMDEAFRLLEMAHREHVPWIAYIKVVPFCDDLRTDLRFDALLQRMNFPA
jgi:TolB-like protein/Flp pilus assembly protein TadD